MCEKDETSTIKPRRDDPYKEFELYLQKAQNEIGKVFQDGGTSSKDPNVIRLTTSSNGDAKKPPAPPPPWFSENNRGKGVKALVQLEALLHGLSRAHAEEDPERDLGSPLLRQCSACAKSNPPDDVCTQRELRETRSSESGRNYEFPSAKEKTTLGGTRDNLIKVMESRSDWWNSSKSEAAKEEKLPRNIPANSFLDNGSAHESVKGNCRSSKDCIELSDRPHVVNMEALSSWAEKLACEMNNIGDEDEENNSKRKDARWVLKDSNEVPENGLGPVVLDNAKKWETRATRCDQQVKDNAESVDSLEDVSENNKKTLEGSTDSDSLLFEDAREGPLVEKVKEVTSSFESPVKTQVDLTFASPVSVVEVRVRSESSSSNPPAFQRLSVEYCSRGEDEKVADPERIHNARVVNEKRETRDDDEYHVIYSRENENDRREDLSGRGFREIESKPRTTEKDSPRMDNNNAILSLVDQTHLQENETLNDRCDIAADQSCNNEMVEPVESHLSRLSSTTSTLSSSGSQMKPEDVQEFIRRVETSIWESESLKRRKKGLEADDATSPVPDDVFRALTEEEEEGDRNFFHVGTQTSPCVSRSSSVVWVTCDAGNSADRIRDNSEIATVGSMASPMSISCSSIDILSTVSASSSFGEETTDVEQSTSDTTTTTTEFALCLDDELQITDDRDAKEIVGRNAYLNHASLINAHPLASYTPLRVAEEDVWVKREDVESQTSRSPNREQSPPTTRPPPPPPLKSNPRTVRETSSDTNISTLKENDNDNDEFTRLTHQSAKNRPFILHGSGSSSAPTSAASSPSTEGPSGGNSAINPSLITPPPLNILNTTPKSSSAPVLDVRHLSVQTDGDTGSDATKSLNSSTHSTKVIPPPRSQSVKELAELEAVEACQWLKAAGFPQYSQMFEDMQFPINVAAVQKDHYFLDADSIQSLFRRLNALNKCARMRLDSIPRKSIVEDSDEETQCALSENWTFERHSRRWSRIHNCLEPCVSQLAPSLNGQKETVKNGHKLSADSIPDSPVPMDEDGSGGSASVFSLDKSGESASPSPETRCTSFRRSGSERLKDGAKAFLRRMESFKSKRNKRRNREVVVISGPHVTDQDGMDQRVQQLACVDLSPQIGHRRSGPEMRSALKSEDGCSLNSASDTSQTSTPTTRTRSRSTGGCRRSPSQPRSDSETTGGGLSDSEYSPPLWRANNVSSKLVIENCVPNDRDNVPADGTDHFNFRTGSFHLRKENVNHADRKKQKRASVNSNAGVTRTSVYDNVPPSVICNKYYTNKQEENKRKISFLVEDEKKVTDDKGTTCLNFHHDTDSCSSASTNFDFDIAKSSQETKTDGLAYSPTNSCVRKLSIVSQRRGSSGAVSVSINTLSAAQLMVLRKLSLLKLTALMERYSPSNRSGWSWIMPKFIKRMKVPDYKDKVVFGVPLTVIHQRTGQPLPPSIQAAILFLKKNAMDSVGIFRKSGVRSRIQKLKNMCEANPINISFDGQQTYDVADMLKQYFRELPEALLTNKMSETFISIYQYIPEELRLEAVQSVVMLIPDENREILQKLLSFLHDVSIQAHENQMTASNLAVCFAPSLFHMNTPRSTSSSPRRRKTAGIPDQKELNENRAAHDCLTQLIKDNKKIFTVSDDGSYQCRVSFADDEEPMTLSEIGSLNGCEGNWKTYLNMCIQNHFKERREKAKGWISVPTHDNAELAFKKIGDGNPLRLWRATVEVEAPPIELLNRVLRERHLWDDQLLKWRVLAKLDSCTEIFHYVQNSMSPLPAKDYCILRSWRSDLPKGTCVLVESSLDYSEAPLLLGDVRGLVYVSRYLIEPCGSGKSRIIYISRIDTKGRSLEWYNRVYGHICALHLLRIGNSFRHNAEGPESKV